MERNLTEDSALNVQDGACSAVDVFFANARDARERSRRELRDLAAEFRDRANHFGRLAYISEFLVAICIFGGIYTFWYSDQILLKIQESRMDSLEKERSYEQAQILREREAITANRSEIEALEKAIKANDLSPQAYHPPSTSQLVTPLPPGLAELQQARSPNEARLSDLKRSVAKSERLIESGENNIQSIDSRRKELRSAPESQVAIALATKIGAVLLLLFFVRVLVSIFRYYSRLAAFYLARGDAVQYFTSVTPLSFSEFAALVLPSGVEFEKAPDTPDLPSIAALKELMATRAKP